MEMIVQAIAPFTKDIADSLKKTINKDKVAENNLIIEYY